MNVCAALVGGFVIALVTATVAAGSDLAGTEWRPVRIDSPSPEDDAFGAFLHFGEEGRVSGYSGCNRFSGRFHTNGTRIVIGPLASTRMACRGFQLELDKAVFGALEAAQTYRREQSQLSFFDADGTEVGRFTQIGAD